MGKDQELLQAVKTEDLITVQKLLQRPKPGKAKLLGSAKKVNVNFQDIDGFAPLHHAALNGNLELIALLLESQAAVDVRDQKGMRPLHYAAWQGKSEPIRMLLKSGSSVNGQSDEGQIPLHLAAQHGHYDVSEMLLQYQSNPCIVDNAGKTPLDLACEFGRVGVVQLLLNSNMCAALLEPKPGNPTDPNGTSPLHLAAKNGHIDIIRLLIQAGIDINWQTKSGTALHEAALCGKTEAVRLLLDSGINAAVRNTYSQTALDIVHQFTASQASKEIKQMLRDASAALQVRALKDYCNNYDLTSLNIKAGDIISVLEQHPDGRWKGCIHDNRTGNDRVGYFPSSLVEVISKRAGASWNTSTGPDAPSISDRQIQAGTGDRSSMGSSGSVASGRSSGSGQSAGSGSHALHAQAEGVKLLATVLSQSTKAKEHLLEQSKSLEQSTAPSSRSQSSPSCPYHEPAYGEAAPPAQRKGEVPSEEKSSEAVIEWLSTFQLQAYGPNFISEGYDMSTISRMTPEDLAAIGVNKPGHRKKMTSEISKLSATEWHLDQKPADLAEWLSMIGLGQYYQILVNNGYESIDFITDITWEDLQEIGITKLGHQKKLMLAVRKLAEIQKTSEGRKRKGPQSVEVVSIQSPPHDGVVVTSPKLSTFQDSELSGELQAALSRTGERQQGTEAKPRTRPAPNSGPAKSREPEEGGGAPPRKEARAARQSSQGAHRGNVPPALSKSRQSYPSGGGSTYTPPQTPTKTKPSPQQTTGPAQAKVKGATSSGGAAEQTTTTPSLPQSPKQKTHVHKEPRDGVAAPPPSPTPGPLPVAVPTLCLPPGEEPEVAEGKSQKRAHSQSRHVATDGEEPGATTVASTPRGSATLGPADKNTNRGHSFARPRKKGPPPPPPKRSSSAISSPIQPDDAKEPPSTGLLDVGYRPQRRASDLGAAVDTGSAGSVRSIAAMLEMSSIGGGPKALQKSPGGQHHLQVNAEHGQMTGTPVGGKPRDAIGLDGEVVNRRRTISGPVTELVAAARRERGPREPQPKAGAHPELPGRLEEHSLQGPAGNMHVTADGTLMVKQHPRQVKGEDDGLPAGSCTVPPEEASQAEATGTLKRRSRAKLQADGVRFHLTESSTVKRRPKSRDKDSEEEVPESLVPAPCQNGTQWVQEHSEGIPRRDSRDNLLPPGPEGPKPPKPPVSPKPILAQHMKKTGPSGPTPKRVPLPGPGSPGSPEVKRVPPPVSPKPAPPPTAPKPTKVQIIPHPISVSPAPALASTQPPALTPTLTQGRIAGTPPSAGPLTPQSPQTAQALVLSPAPTPTPPPPVKPPRSSIGGASIDSGGGVEAAQQRLEETSASLAAALQAVEEKIRKEEKIRLEDGSRDTVAEEKSTVSILDDIGSMFDELADQLDAMLE
ncbi:caskin-1-like isoform X9 [Brienomyrus brachyistius]|uniref:caskin-1-like isoform X9 n=1 Tax=Brienomyrus brachyistius TaxID=42636 RepID=UPI0020B30FA6|nr:caskin-1-like isoform X9 [Brienomyrus brachyistius]